MPILNQPKDICLNSAAPLKSFPLLKTSDIDVVSNSVCNNFHDADIEINASKFYMAYNFFNMGRVSFSGIELSSGCRVTPGHDINSFAVFMMVFGEKHIVSADSDFTCHAGCAALLDFSDRAVLIHENAYANLVVRFTRQGLEDSLAALIGQPACSCLAFTSLMDLKQPGPSRLARILWQVVETFENDIELLKSPLLITRYEELIMTALLTSLEHNYSAKLVAKPVVAEPKIVKIAEDFIEANADKPLKLTDLTSVTGVSFRSIQMAFKKYRSYSPSRFMQECRLAKSRQMLKFALPGTTVLSVAHACGFASQGYFSKLYRERFGEKPSDTLRFK